MVKKRANAISFTLGKRISAVQAHVHGVKADRVTEAVYLGDIIREDGKNSSNIKDRVRKGLGIVTRIMNILETISFGSKYFEIATTLRQAELINGIVTNSEVWYGTTRAQIEELEEVNKLLIRRILNAPLSDCIESLHLELGLTPIHIIIKGLIHFIKSARVYDSCARIFAQILMKIGLVVN